jgi:hypothetical protein
LLFVWVIVEPSLSNSYPLTIADGLFTSCHWRDWDNDNVRFVAILERKFPVGTNAAQLKFTLLGQGFRPAPLRDCCQARPHGQDRLSMSISELRKR